MTDEQLAEIEARAAKATPGPWHHDDLQTVQGGTIAQQHLAVNVVDPRDEYGISPQGHCDADFIAHARQDIPALIAEVRSMRRAIASWKQEEQAWAEERKAMAARIEFWRGECAERAMWIEESWREGNYCPSCALVVDEHMPNCPLPRLMQMPKEPKP